MLPNSKTQKSTSRKWFRRIKSSIKTKYVLILSPIILFALIYLSLPFIIGQYISYKGWNADSISIHVDGTINFYGLNNGNNIYLNTVIVKLFDRNIRTIGGNVEIDAVQKTKNSNIQGWNLLAEKLNVKIKYKNILVNLNDTSYNGKEIYFKQGKVYKSPIGEVLINNGKIEKENKTLQAEKIKFQISSPIKLPIISQKYEISITNASVDYNAKSLKARLIEIISPNEGVYLQDCSVMYSEHIIIVSIKKLNVNHRWISNYDNYPTFDDMVNIQFSPKSLDFVISIGDISLHGNLKNKKIISENNTCIGWLENIPIQRKMPFDDFEFISGHFNFLLDLKRPKVKINSDCKLQCNNTLISSLRRKFTYTAIDKEGNEFVRESGPSSNSWISLTDMSPSAHKAVVMMEDPAFDHHKGYLKAALFNSLKINLKEGKFIRGGSTITMQLVRNLWFGRDKTLDRKLAEIIWSEMLEKCLSKYEILEIYMNVVEFGPDVYGIGNASRYYFKKHPRDLEPDESLFLARMLPNPSKTISMRGTHSFMRKWNELDKLPEDFRMEEVLDEE